MFTTSTISMAATITAAAAWLMEATVSACFEIWSWTTSQCTWLSQLAMDKPFVAVITLAVVSLSWCCLCSCFRQLPPKRKGRLFSTLITVNHLLHQNTTRSSLMMLCLLLDD